jgi:hypothetical protein
VSNILCLSLCNSLLSLPLSNILKTSIIGICIRVLSIYVQCLHYCVYMCVLSIHVQCLHYCVCMCVLSFYVQCLHNCICMCVLSIYVLCLYYSVCICVPSIYVLCLFETTMEKSFSKWYILNILPETCAHPYYTCNSSTLTHPTSTSHTHTHTSILLFLSPLFVPFLSPPSPLYISWVPVGTNKHILHTAYIRSCKHLT